MTSASLSFDPATLTALIEQKKFAEAKKIIDDVLDEDLTPKQKGEIYVKVASLYLDITNRVSKEYIAELDTTIALLKKVGKNQKDTDAKMKLAEVKANLKNDSK